MLQEQFLVCIHSYADDHNICKCMLLVYHLKSLRYTGRKSSDMTCLLRKESLKIGLLTLKKFYVYI